MITKGQKINDRYEIIKSIGEGGMANVYLAYDTILDRKVAIKVLRGDLSGDEKFVRRFQREALSASSLAHPNIVEMYDVGEDNGIYYIVMEYIDGITIKQLLKKRGSLTLSEVIDIMLQLTDGMAHAHDAYIIHRDLKPQNIMIKDDGQIKITDFGIAMALNSTQLTQTNSVMGSVHYLPPEQATGKGATIKSDIYSMGIIFYELLTGKLPFRGENAVEIALKQMKEKFPSIIEDNPEYPQSIENIIIRCTAKNPKNRYEDAKKIYEDLLTALDDSRMNEKEYKFKYPENDNEETKKIDRIEEIADENSKTEELFTKIEDSEDKKNKILVIILSTILSIALLTLVFVFVILPKFEKKKSVTIPDCTGLRVSTCEKKLQKLGFTIESEIEEISSNEVSKNKVVKTQPAKNRVVKYGTTIKIYKSLGESTYTVENYVGKNYNEVKAKLEVKYSLVVNIMKKDVDKQVEDSNLIIEQSVNPGTKLKKGETIILYIPNVIEKIPDMKGWTKDEAESFAKQYELNITFIEEPTTAYKEGTVFEQSLRYGSKIVKGANLKVTIAVKPKPSVSPSPSPSPSPSSETTPQTP